MTGTTHLMALSALGRDELKRRIQAARILRGLEQVDLDELFSEDGLGKSAGRLERGDERIHLTRALLDGLVRHLRVPEEWFTSPDVDELVQGTDYQLETELAEIRAGIDRLLSLQEEQQTGATRSAFDQFGPDAQIERRQLRSRRSTDPRAPRPKAVGGDIEP